MRKEERTEVLTYLLIFTIMFFIVGSLLGCNNPKAPGTISKEYGDFNIKQIDGCEYLEYDYGIIDQRVYSLTHKGNCKNLYHNNK